jgi:hypothetical protein
MYPNTDLPSYIKQESKVENKSLKKKICNRIDAHTGSNGASLITLCMLVLIVVLWYLIGYFTYYILNLINTNK